MVCVAQDESGGRSVYRFSLSSSPAPVAPIAGPAFAAGRCLPPICDKCHRAHVITNIDWVAVTRAGAVVFCTAGEDVYLADGEGCGARLVASLQGCGARTAPVLLRDASAFLFSTGDAIWAVSLLSPQSTPPSPQPQPPSLSSFSSSSAATHAAHLSPVVRIASANVQRDIVGTMC